MTISRGGSVYGFFQPQFFNDTGGTKVINSGYDFCDLGIGFFW